MVFHSIQSLRAPLGCLPECFFEFLRSFDSLERKNMSGLRLMFDTTLEQMRSDLLKDLKEVNVLDKKCLEDFLAKFNQKIIAIQTEFLSRLSAEESTIKISFDKPSGSSANDFGKIVISGLAASGGAAATLTFVTISSSTGMAALWAWITGAAVNVTIAGWLAATLGISAGMATIIASGGFGLLIAGGAAYLLRPRWAKRIRKQIIENCDEIISKLWDWFEEIISTIIA